MGWRNILKPQQEFKEFKELPPLKHEQVAQVPQVLASVEPRISDSYYMDFFEERAAIAEFDGCQSREKAEAIVYQDTVYEWIYNNPPAGYKIEKCAYCNEAFDFSVGGYLAWGNVYCCHNGDNDDHLKPYMESRTKEAKQYLKSIGIKQPTNEA
jgi:hypothetical protein